jgi:lipopolysaccharide export system protein LptA
MKHLWLIGVCLVAGAPGWAQSNVTVLGGTPVTTNEPTVVTSDKLEVDYAKGVGTFTGNVLAVDPRITVRADKVIATFTTGTNTTRSIQSLHAEGGVVLSQENRKATAEKAEYDAAEGRVVLTGHPKVETADGTVSGGKITFWRGKEKMEVVADATETNRTQLIFQPEPAPPPQK